MLHSPIHSDEPAGATARFLVDFDRQSHDRGDGYDARDPNAALIFCCDGCDEYRETEQAFCASCNAVTGSYLGHGAYRRSALATAAALLAAAETLEVYEAEYRADCHQANAVFDTIRNAGMRKAGLL